MIYLLIVLFGAALSYMGPWWIGAAVAFIVCRWKAKSSKQAFVQSALALSSLWVGYALFIFLNSDVDMATKMTGILTSSVDGFGKTSNINFIFGITALLSSTIGGLAGLAGFSLKRL
jgi:hypothetical protein